MSAREKIERTIEQITVTGEGLTLSGLVWRRFQKPMSGVVGEIYELNPGLSRLPIELPVGTVVRVPVPDQESKEAVIDLVTLWSAPDEE